MFSDVPPRQGGSLADAAFCARTRTRACAMRCTTTTACCLFHSTSAIAYNYLQEPQKITPCDAFCRFVPSASAVAGSCRGPQQVGGLRCSVVIKLRRTSALRVAPMAPHVVCPLTVPSPQHARGAQLRRQPRRQMAGIRLPTRWSLRPSSPGGRQNAGPRPV